MSTELSSNSEQFIDQLVAAGRFASRQQALDRAVDLLREEAETIDDLREGLASIERGEGAPLADAVNDLRAKFGIADDA